MPGLLLKLLKTRYNSSVEFQKTLRIHVTPTHVEVSHVSLLEPHITVNVMRDLRSLTCNASQVNYMLLLVTYH